MTESTRSAESATPDQAGDGSVMGQVAATCWPCQNGHPDDYPCWNGWLEDEEGYMIEGDAERFTEPFTEVLCECEKCHPERV